MYSFVVKLAGKYLDIIKISNIKYNMGLRILHSLIYPLIKDSNQAKQISENLANQIIPGAIETLRLGTKMCIDELQYSLSMYSYESAKIKFNISPKFTPILEFCIEEFKDPKNWATSFGGAKWSYFASTLIKLEKSLESYASGNKEASMYIVVLLNIIDGMQHNSGAMLEKMLLEEFKEQAMSWTEMPFQDEKRKIRTLLDSKQLSEPSDVWWVVKQINKNIPYMFRRELASKISPPNRNRIETELKNIRKFKESNQNYNLMLKPIIEKLVKLQNSKIDEDVDIAVEDLLEIGMDFPEFKPEINDIFKKYKIREKFALKSSDIYKKSLDAAREIEKLVLVE